jgi:hypothetical protein
MHPLTRIITGTIAMLLVPGVASAVQQTAQQCQLTAASARGMAIDRDHGHTERQELQAAATMGFPLAMQHFVYAMAHRVWNDWRHQDPDEIYQRVYNRCMAPTIN